MPRIERSSDVQALRARYQDLFSKFGANHNAVQWSSEPTQQARFGVLTDFVQRSDRVLDLGCGLGDLLHYLRDRRDFRGEYLGLDIVPEFIEHAQRKYRFDREAQFVEFDITREQLPRGYDAVVICGLFNDRMRDNWGFMKSSLTKAYEATRCRVAMNAMSTYVDFQDSELSYVDPLQVFDFCKRTLGAQVTLRHDYRVKADTMPYEFALYLCK